MIFYVPVEDLVFNVPTLCSDLDLLHSRRPRHVLETGDCIDVLP